MSGLRTGLSYTFSAYMKTSSISTDSTATGGAFLKAGGTYSRRYQLSTSSFDGGWQQIYCTFTASSETVNLACGLVNCTGTVYFDNVQLVRHSDPPQISLVSNGDAEDDTDWEDSSNTGYSSAYYLSGARSIYVDGSPDSVRSKYQRIRVNRSSDSTYVVSGWARANSAPQDSESKLNTPTFGLAVHIRYYSGEIEDHYIPFNSDVTGWQYVSAPIVPKESGKVVDYIDLIVTYNYNINTAYFDDLSLVIESCASYKYNEDGKVVAVNATEESELTAQYTGTDITLLNDEASGDYEYTYDSAHNVTSVTWDGITQNLSYNSGKLNTYTSLTAGGYTMWSSAEYDSSHDHLTSTVDATGRRVNYGYSIEDESTYKRTTQDSTLAGAGANISELYDAATGNTLLLDRQDGDVYIEYADGKVSAVTPIPNDSYTTAQAMLQSAASAANDGASGYQYKYTYDKWGNLTKVTVGGKTLTEKTYDDTTGNLLTSLLPFGDTLSYTHDLFGRLEKITDADGETLVSYDYDGLGNIATVTDYVGHLTTEAHYDSIGRLLLQIGYSWGTTRDRSISYTYDSQGRLSGRTLYFDGIGGSESYTYDSSGLVTQKTSANGDLYNVVYDAFNRVNQRVVNSSGGSITQRYEYYLAHSDTCLTPLPKRVVYSDGTKEWISAGATYDGAYNVTELQRYTLTEATFTYDSAHRLSTATYSDGDTVSYSYDNRGNITSKTVTENGTTRTVSYGYGGTQADALKSYDGVNFTYNKYGYPTGYYNGDSYTFTWDTYGNLSGSTKEGVAQSYTYNASGQRITKTASGVTSTYYYDGDTLMLQKNSDGTSLLFTYNEAGDPVGFTRRENGIAYNYYFITNLQGDVIQVLDGNYDTVCNYYYDAWGTIRLITDADGNDITDSENPYSIAYINPIRYRGYYYDVETGFYYLQTRYYDPEIGRFISRDSYEYIGANGDIGSHNLFAYCSNNPVGRIDHQGYYWETAADLVFIGMDVYSLTTEEGWKDWKNWCALGADLLFTGIPFATGGGQIVKAGDTINDLSKVTVVGETMGRVEKFAKSVNATENLYGGFQAYKMLRKKGMAGKILAEVGGKLDNAAWLFGKLRFGYVVVDIGIDVKKVTRSSSYIMESIVLKAWKFKSVIKGALKILEEISDG